MTFFEVAINKLHHDDEANYIHLFERLLGIKKIGRRICPVESVIYMRHSFSDNDYGQGIPSKLNKVKRAANIGSLACPLAPMV